MGLAEGSFWRRPGYSRRHGQGKQGLRYGERMPPYWHRSAFDLKSGKLVGPWCPAPPLIGPLTGKLKSPKELKTFQARTQGGKVQVLLDVNAKKRFDANYWRGILDAQGKVDGGYY